MTQTKHKYSTYALVLLVGILMGAYALAALDTNDLDEVCETDDTFLIRTGGTWNCSNTTALSVFNTQYIFSHSNHTQLVTAANEWTNITFIQEDADVKKGIEHYYGADNDTFNITRDGLYLVTYDVDIIDISVGASDINVAVRLVYMNGSEIEGSVFETDIFKNGEEVELTHSFLSMFYADEQVKLQFIADDPDVEISTHGTFGDYPESVSIVINKVAN